MVCLSDVKWKNAADGEFKYGVRQFDGPRGRWTIVHHGKVAVAMDAATTADWRKGGARITTCRGGAKARNIMIELPRHGWRRGRSIMSVYAPTSGRRAGQS